MKHNNIWEDLKPLVFFLAGGTFAKLHKMFMEPSSNLAEWANDVHHWIHSVIGISLQIIIFLWLVKIIGIEFVIPFVSLIWKKWRK